jgi:L-threonylcarbamoyladenylate synthase
MPTDTIYGIVGRAESEAIVSRIYTLRKRNPQKPCIILIAHTDELEKFSINISEGEKKELRKYWPSPVSIILDCPNEQFSYLHRGTRTLAFRMPAEEELRDLLSKTGPLIAPSANSEGLPPAQNITDARKYFADSVDLYLDAGEIKGKASKVIKLHKDGTVTILRE